MDTTDPDIVFDENGVCNHCHNYDARIASELHYGKDGKERIGRIVEEIKKSGSGKEYDCVIGISGGVDSTFVAYHVKKLGLRPLAIHFDNGWNSELSVNNIENILKKLEIELYTYVADWEKFKSLQLAFLKSSVVNCEIPTDHAILALLYNMAREKGIKYIITGSNIVTEGIMPFEWVYDSRDLRFLKAINRKFGNADLKNYPQFRLIDWLDCVFVKRIKYIPILNYIPFKKSEAKKLIADELGWRDYGGKHYESIYTRFYQGYILLKKFGIDKRRAHLSALILSGQIKREEAIEELKKSPYLDEKMLEDDKNYVIKKLGLKEEEFERIMKELPKSYRDYPNNHFLFRYFGFFIKFAKKIATRNY